MTFVTGPAVVLGERYRLTERIATGGQGEVWRAEDTALGRTVAVKVLRGEYTGDAEFRDRFRREARHAAALSHPGVAQVFDYDEGGADVPPYLVMEFVEGESLSAEIARSAPAGADRVLEVIAAVASALAAAHAAGVVHRDVKPGNLLVGRDGSIKITDFGIARAVDAAPLTRAGLLMGTPSYLAPEAAAGRPVTAAGDLYALGVIAFEMLTGRPPYEGPAPAVVVAHRDAPLPPLPPYVPPGLGALVLDLTAKDPRARPPGAAAVASRAAGLRAGTRPVGVPGSDTRVLSVPPPGEPSRRRGALPLVAGGIAIALAAGLIGWLARPSQDGGAGAPPAPVASSVFTPTPRPTLSATPRPTRAAPRPVVRKQRGNSGPGHGGHGGHGKGHGKGHG